MTSESLHDPAQSGPSAASSERADLARQFYQVLIGASNLVSPGAVSVSVKDVGYDLLGHAADTLWINATSAPPGAGDPPITAVRLDAVLWLQQIAGLDAALLLLALRQALLRPDLPPPPPSTLLHAVAPGPVVALVQPPAVLAAGATTEPAQLVAAIFGEEVGFVGECAPIQKLAGDAAALLRRQPAARALLIGSCGLLVWGEDIAAVVQTARALAERAEAYAAAQAGPARAAAPAQGEGPQAEISAALPPALRGLLGAAGRGILRLDTSAAAQAALAGVSNAERGAVDSLLGRTGILPIWIDLPAEGEVSTEAPAEMLTEMLTETLAGALSPEDQARLETNGGAGALAVLLPRWGIAGCAASPPAADQVIGRCLHALQMVKIAGELGGYAVRPAQDSSDLALPTPLPVSKRELEGKIALVTGAASGIGRAIALRFAQEGACVAACDINDAGLQEVTAEIEALAGPLRALPVHCDVSDAASVAAAYRQAVQTYGGLDIAVANAGLAMSAGVDEMEVERWRKILDVNLTGYFLTAGEAFRLFKTQGGGGALVFIASKAGLAAGPGSAAYGSTKAAEMHLARILAEEGGPAGIRVNTVCPDAVFRGSAIWQLGWKEERARFYGIKPEEVEDHYRQRCALKVSIYAEDVAEAVLFLASDRAAKTTGAILTVDGGMAGAYVR